MTSTTRSTTSARHSSGSRWGSRTTPDVWGGERVGSRCRILPWSYSHPSLLQLTRAGELHQLSQPWTLTCCLNPPLKVWRQQLPCTVTSLETMVLVATAPAVGVVPLLLKTGIHSTHVLELTEHQPIAPLDQSLRDNLDITQDQT